MHNNTHATIELEYPIQSMGNTVERVGLRRPKVEDILTVEAMGGNEAEKDLYLLAMLCEPPLTYDELKSMDAYSDYRSLLDGLQSFLSPTRSK